MTNNELIKRLYSEQRDLEIEIVTLEVAIANPGKHTDVYALLAQLENRHQRMYQIKEEIRAVYIELSTPKSVFKRLFRK